MPRTLTSSMHTGMFDEMSRAVDRLALNDASVTVRREAKARPTLGAGLRLGFLGLLHMDVFRQRLRDEFGAEVLFTSPTVPYKVRWKDGNATTSAKSNCRDTSPPRLNCALHAIDAHR